MGSDTYLSNPTTNSFCEHLLFKHQQQHRGSLRRKVLNSKLRNVHLPQMKKTVENFAEISSVLLKCIRQFSQAFADQFLWVMRSLFLLFWTLFFTISHRFMGQLHNPLKPLFSWTEKTCHSTDHLYLPCLPIHKSQEFILLDMQYDNNLKSSYLRLQIHQLLVQSLKYLYDR